MIQTAVFSRRRSGAFAASTLGLCLLAAPGCDTRHVEESRTEEHRVPLSEAARLVEVDIADGSITVRPASGTDEVELSIRSVAHSLDREAALALLDRRVVEVDETPTGLSVRSLRVDSRRIALGGVETHISLAVPSGGGLELRLRTNDGRIEIEDIDATVRASTGDGRVRLRNVRGRVLLETEDGDIVARDLDGSLEATAEDGSVEVDGRFDALRAESADGRLRILCRDGSRVESPWLIRTADGSIVLELPDDLDASIEALANDGSLSNDLSGFKGTVSPFRLEGTLGAGGGELFVATLDGSIDLR